jgi:hypothetical protein
MDHLKKREGWNKALKKYQADNPPKVSLRPLELSFEVRLEMARNQARIITPTLVGREFDLLLVWERSNHCVCLCACGRYAAEVSENGLIKGTVKDCGHRAAETLRISRYRRARKVKLRAKEARAERKRVLTLLKKRKRKPARKFWGLSA